MTSAGVAEGNLSGYLAFEAKKVENRKNGRQHVPCGRTYQP
jgi:hypothetical protein